ncbi:MAG: S-methyl-5'-thioadenosine phosphorylase, partial [Gammaproteobacteria bacterium]|nr:S-methyl-5'-thioadenosine phosphorylase [Gammaproteobacteria bacterium]
MNKIAIIGGTGLTSLAGVEITETREVDTPYGSPSSALSFGNFDNKEIIFLPRHGNPHAIPPHKINYRANLHALKEDGVKSIIAVNAVGGITAEMRPGRI